MYDFKSLTSNTKQGYLNSEALFLYTQNDYIENLIDGYVTIKINSYNALKRNVSLVNRNFGNGSIFIDSNLPSKEITIDFFLKANNTEELTQKQTELNNLLFDSQIKFTFQNLRDWFYIGTVSEIEFESGELSPHGTITIVCNDPFRYSNEVVEVNANSTLDTSLGIGKEFKPYELEIQAAATSALNQKTRYFSPSSSLYFLGYTGSGAVTYKFDFNKGELFVNGVKRNELIDIQSDVSNWRIKQGERFAVTSMQGITKCVLRFRRKEVG